MTNLFGYQFTKEQAYVIAWIIMLLFLVVLASQNGGLALGFALTILFAIAITVTNNKGSALNG